MMLCLCSYLSIPTVYTCISSWDLLAERKKKNMAATSFEGALHDDVIVLILLHTLVWSLPRSSFVFGG